MASLPRSAGLRDAGEGEGKALALSSACLVLRPAWGMAACGVSRGVRIAASRAVCSGLPPPASSLRPQSQRHLLLEALGKGSSCVPPSEGFQGEGLRAALTQLYSGYASTG